jgi:uncharacterized membrane protein YfcA
MNLKIYLLLSAAVLVTACDHRMLQDDESPECELSEDCPDFPWYNCKEGSCVHKDVFPIFPIEIVGLIIFCMFMALANVAGVGGGGVAIPLIMAFFHFKTKKAIAISSFTILCCTTARFILNFKEKHPEKPNVTVIDYGMTTVMMPATLVGAQVGALMLLMFPALVIQIILTIVLGLLAWQSTRKAIQITKKENILLKEKLEKQALKYEGKEG